MKKKSWVKSSEIHTVWKHGRGREVVMKLSSNRVTSERRTEWNEGGSHANIWEKVSQAEENHVQRPEVSTQLACSVNSKKVSIIAAERAAVGNVVCALGSDLISHTLFGHDRSLDFTAGVVRSHGKVLRWGSYFSVKNSLNLMGRREARKAARGHLEGARFPCKGWWCFGPG